MSFFNSNQKLIYIKRAKHNGGYKHWFWHCGLGGVAGRQGQKKPFGSQTEDVPVYDFKVDDLNRPIQVGDTVYVVRSKIFGTIVADKGETLDVLQHDTTTVECSADSAAREVFFVSASLAEFDKRKRVPAPLNLCGAQQKVELDFLEKYYAYKTLIYLTRRFPHHKIGERLMLEIHENIFSAIYSWGGVYRTEELVVGNRNAPTIEAKRVKQSIKTFFRNFNSFLGEASKSRDNLVKALVALNRELCWIHPFTDGNGRTIRLLSEILAAEWGYLLNWGMKGNNKRKRSYHQAIRRSLDQNRRCDRQLEIFIDSCLVPSMDTFFPK